MSEGVRYSIPGLADFLDNELSERKQAQSDASVEKSSKYLSNVAIWVISPPLTPPLISRKSARKFITAGRVLS